MGSVYVTTYEIIGDGLTKAREFYGKVEAARSAQWKHVEELGAEGFRPNHNGGVRSILFKELPRGWRSIGRDGDKTEAVPRRGTKAGKAAQYALDALPRAPVPGELATALGYSPSEMAMDRERGTIYFPTELSVAYPAERFFVRLPRFDKDGFTPNDAELRAIPESELMKAVEDHNTEARRQRERKAA